MIAECTIPNLMSDEEVVGRVREGDIALYEVIMRRYNQRLYRVTWSILRNEHEAQDVMQDAYVRAYANLHQFAGNAKFATWLTRIAVHEALARRDRNRRLVFMPGTDNGEEAGMDQMRSPEPNPETQTADAEARALLERSIAALPETYRSVLILRDIDGLSTEDTAACLELTEENVKTRLHRARRMVRHEIQARTGIASTQAFLFLGARCDRMVEIVMARIIARSESEAN